MKTTTKVTLASILTAIILIMAFTPLGYLKTAGLEISFLAIPVTIGAILLGPRWGAYLGGVFGLTSFLQCFGMSAFGEALLAINPYFTFIVCMVPRVLMGLGVGLIFKGLQRATKRKAIPYTVASISGALLNTIFFMTALVVFFYNTEFIQGFVNAIGAKGVLSFIVLFVGINGLAEVAAAFVITLPVVLAVSRYAKKFNF